MGLSEQSAALFVYGTLMPGHSRWPVLEPHAVETTAAHAAGELWDTGFGYPAARFDPSAATTVPGVVVTVAPDRLIDLLDVLDGIEGEGRLFRRITVATSAGPAVAYEWLGATDGMRPLPDGWTRPARPL